MNIYKYNYIIIRRYQMDTKQLLNVEAIDR